MLILLAQRQRSLEDIYYPTPTTIAKKILSILKFNADIVIETSPEINSFKGLLMNYLKHQTEFGEEFNIKLTRIRKLISENIYV